MSRAPIGFLAAAAIGSAFTFVPSAASAGCCGWSGNCCNSYAPVVYAQPQVQYVQPQIQYVQPAPTVVQVQPAPVIVEVAPPQVIVQQQQAYETVMPSYQVNQGPVYSGPGTDYSVPYYQAAQTIQPYPYYRSYRWRSHYYAPRRHHTYRQAWRHHRYVSHRGPVKKYYK
jgi:hypothetical protein